MLYGLVSAWLYVKEQRQLEGFQAKCLWNVLRIRPSYFSRVTNLKVLEYSEQTLYTSQLLKHQLILYGKLARLADDDALRTLAFTPGSLQPAQNRYIRRVGRPRQEWDGQLYMVALKVAGRQSVDDFRQSVDDFIRTQSSWSTAVDMYINNKNKVRVPIPLEYGLLLFMYIVCTPQSISICIY